MGDGSNRFERSAKWQGKLSALHYVVVVMYRRHLHCHQNGLVTTRCVPGSAQFPGEYEYVSYSIRQLVAELIKFTHDPAH